jgi:hypothetical protein
MRHLLVPALAACLWLAPFGGRAEQSVEKTRATAIAVIDFDYVDTSGEARDQRQEHQARLDAFMHELRRNLGEAAKFRLITPTCGQGPCSVADATLNELVVAARKAGADVVLVGGLQKTSTLVQWAKIRAIDVRSERVVLEKLFTFRGDTDEAWRRAETFIFNEIATLQPS